MAFNPRESEIKDGVPVEIKPLPDTSDYMKMHVKKPEYYIEFWRFGNKEHQIEEGYFHSDNLKHTLLLLKRTHTIVYLERVKDKRVIWNKRAKK